MPAFGPVREPPEIRGKRYYIILVKGCQLFSLIFLVFSFVSFPVFTVPPKNEMSLNSAQQHAHNMPLGL